MFAEVPPQRRPYSMLELVYCAEREAKLRKQVYPRRVANRQMTRAFAEAEIGRMEAIAFKLKELARSEGWVV